MNYPSANEIMVGFQGALLASLPFLALYALHIKAISKQKKNEVKNKQ